MSLPSFIFGGDTGKSYADIQRERSIMEALQARAASTAPRNVGEGLSAIGQALAYRFGQSRLDRAEADRSKTAEGVMNPILAALGGSSAPAASSAANSPAVADALFGSPKSAGKDPAPVDLSGDKATFVSSLMPAAIEAGQRTGIDPRIIVAQAAQETGWGRSAPGNNYFGIKSHGQGGGQNLATQEVINGQRVNVRDSFRTFDSPAASVSGYADFMTSNPRYQPMMQAQGLDAQVAALGASGYATDPNYARSVGAIARGLPMPAAPANAAQAIDAAAGPGAGVQTASADPSFMPGGGSSLAPLPAPQSVEANPVPPQQPVGQQMAQAAPAQGSMPSLQMLYQALQNPALDDQQRSMVGMLIQQQMKTNAPLTPAERLAQEKFAYDRRRDATEDQRWQQEYGLKERQFAKAPDAPTSVREFEYAKANGFAGSYSDWEAAQKKNAASSVTVNSGDTSATGAFYKTADEARAKSYVSMADLGPDAARRLVQIDQLEGILGNVQTGGLARAKQFAGEWGINTDGLSDIQAATALINKMVPSQRAPGSGSMSDADLELFKASLPRIINQPGGNALIIQTMRGIANYDAKVGGIAARVLNREIDPAQGQSLLASIENPLARFSEAARAKDAPKDGDVARPVDEDAYNALPSGALFVDPDDGKTYRKP